MSNNWSIKAIQDLVSPTEKWDKKTLYATDSEKCPSGVYYALTGEMPTTPDDPRGLRRMEVGSMVESNQVKKLKSLGILIEAQRRIFDEEHNVSGRHDGIVISPTECTPRAKELIERKKVIFKDLEKLESGNWKWIEAYSKGETTKDKLSEMQLEIIKSKQDLYDEEKKINEELLVPNPENSLILMEIKSIVESGFKFREKDGAPMSSHTKQLMFYLWKLRQIYPYILGRVVYVDTSYQNIMEFDVQYDEMLIDDLKKFWSMMNEAIKNRIPPPPSPDIAINSFNRKWQVNFQAEWCKYHIKCTGDPNWLEKAKAKVEKLNGTPKTRKSKI